MRTYRSTDSYGVVIGDGSLGVDWDMIETDADGNNSTGMSAPVYYPEDPYNLYETGWSFGTISNGESALHVSDGLHVPLEYATGGTQFGEWALDMLFRSTEWSRRQIGVRNRGVNWGRSFTYDRLFDGTRNIWLGGFDPLLETVNFGIETPILSNNWTIDWSVFGSDPQRTSGTRSGKQNNQKCQLPRGEDLVGTRTGAALAQLFGEDIINIYDSFLPEDQAVLLNTIDALLDAGVDLSNAVFDNFYRSTKPGNSSFGIYLRGLNESRLGNLEDFGAGYRSPGKVYRGGLEIQFLPGGRAHIDLDLRNPNSGLLGIVAHLFIDVFKNFLTNKPTNPHKVNKELNKRKVSTRYKCK